MRYTANPKSHLTATVRQLPAVPRLPRPLPLGVLLAALALAVGIFASVLTGPASAATSARKIDPQDGSYVYIHDDEPFFDENELFDMSHLSSLVVSPSHLVSTLSSKECAGGEVLVEYQIRSELSKRPPGWVLVTLSAQLYEGASCHTTDLDGTASTSFWIRPDATESRTLTVHNDQEGGDYAKLHFAFKNADWNF